MDGLGLSSSMKDMGAKSYQISISTNGLRNDDDAEDDEGVP